MQEKSQNFPLKKGIVFFCEGNTFKDPSISVCFGYAEIH